MEEIKKCLECGEVNSIKPHYKTGIPTCTFCGSEYRSNAAGFSQDLNEIVNSRNRRNFIEASERARDLIQQQPDCAEAYWQGLLADMGVVYVKDASGDGKSKPTFFRYSYDERDTITNNEFYKKAIELSSGRDREIYEEKAAEIDGLLKIFFAQVAKEASYDIFISFKKSEVLHLADGGEQVVDTKDYLKAQEIYNHLKDKYKVFFSPVSIGQDTGIQGEKYEPRILKALQTSQAMILLGSKKEYLEAEWVANEWKRYQYFIDKGFKSKKSLIMGYDTNMPEMPLALKEKQIPNFDWYRAGYLGVIDRQIEFVKSSKGRKSAIKEKKIAEFGEEEWGGFTLNTTNQPKRSGNSVPLNANAQTYLQIATDHLENGRWKEAKAEFEHVLSVNANNSKAYIGLIKVNLKQKTETGLVQNAFLAKETEFEYFKKALEFAADETEYWYIVDILIGALKPNHAEKKDVSWQQIEPIFDFVFDYLDEERIKRTIDVLMQQCYYYYAKKRSVEVSERIFAKARTLFLESNKEYNLQILQNYAIDLFNNGFYNNALNYFCELAGVKKDEEAYLYLLKSKLKTKDLTTKKFNLPVREGEQEDSSTKKVKDLDYDEIIERILICTYLNKQNLVEEEQEDEDANGDLFADLDSLLNTTKKPKKTTKKGSKKQANNVVNTQIIKTLTEMVVYQINNNRANSPAFIDLIVGCLRQLDQEEVAKQFLFDVSEEYLVVKDFTNANKYYNEILHGDENCAMAYWGVVKSLLKASTDYQVFKKKEKLYSEKVQVDYNKFLACASEEERKMAMDIYNGKVAPDVVKEPKIKTPKVKTTKTKTPKAKKYKGYRKPLSGKLLTLIILCSALLLFMGLSIAMAFSPAFLFKLFNFKIVIVIFALVLIATIVVVAVVLSKLSYDTKISYTQEGVARTLSTLALAQAIFALILSLFVMFAIVPKTTFGISSAKDLVLLKNLPKAGHCSYVLENDIDCKGKNFAGWGAIEDFHGTFDGNFYSIKNYNCEVDIGRDSFAKFISGGNTSRNGGLVGRNYGTIKNLTFDNCNFVANYSGEYFNMGMIAGINYGSIRNCKIYDSTLNVVAKDKIVADSYVCGIAGENTSKDNNKSVIKMGTISNCKVYNTITTTKTTKTLTCTMQDKYYYSTNYISYNAICMGNSGTNCTHNLTSSSYGNEYADN